MVRYLSGCGGTASLSWLTGALRLPICGFGLQVSLECLTISKQSQSPFWNLQQARPRADVDSAEHASAKTRTTSTDRGCRIPPPSIAPR